MVDSPNLIEKTNRYTTNYNTYQSCESIQNQKVYESLQTKWSGVTENGRDEIVPGVA